MLGRQDFVEKIKKRLLRNKQPNRGLPGLKEKPVTLSLKYIENVVDDVISLDKKLSRQVKLYFCHHFSGAKLKDIGIRLGIGESGVNQASRRIGERI